MQSYAAVSMSLGTRDEIFSAMVVYGFLTYHDGRVSVPNHELMLKFEDLMKNEGLGYVARLARRSDEVLAATMAGDAVRIAQVAEAAHDEEVPLLRYRHEADLAALVNLVYLSARDRYRVEREARGGKGFADVSFTPVDSRDASTPPFVVELKCDGTTDEALVQIRSRGYLERFSDGLLGQARFPSPPLAVAIVWDPDTKVYACAIEEQ